MITIGFSTLYFINHYKPNGGSYMGNLAGGGAVYGKEVSVVVINLSDDGALNTKQALFSGEFYLLMQVMDAKRRIFFRKE